MFIINIEQHLSTVFGNTAQNTFQKDGQVCGQIHLRHAACSVPTRKLSKDLFVIFSG